MHPTASMVSNVAFLVLPLLVAGAMVYGHSWAIHRIGRGHSGSFGLRIAMWLVLTAGLAASGVLRNFTMRPAPMMLVMIAGVLLAVWLGGGAVGERMAEGLPLAAILGFQAFRLPLEIVMNHAAAEGTMPVQMSFSGSNYDIISGIGAIIMAWLVSRGKASPALVKGWAVVTSVLLAVIIVIAVASTPLLAAYGQGPRHVNTFIGWFPFVWLPTVLVPAALLGQIVLFRRLSLGSIDD